MNSHWWCWLLGLVSPLVYLKSTEVWGDAAFWPSALLAGFTGAAASIYFHKRTN